MTPGIPMRSWPATMLVATLGGAVVLGQARPPDLRQVQLKTPTVTAAAKPIIQSIAPVGTDGVPRIRPGQPFTIVGRNLTAKSGETSVVLSAAPPSGHIAIGKTSRVVLKTTLATPSRLSVNAPPSLPAGLARCLIVVVTAAGQSNEMKAMCGADRVEPAPTAPPPPGSWPSPTATPAPPSSTVSVSGYVRDEAHAALAGIRVTAYDPTRTTPYEAHTDPSGHYELRVPNGFTGQINVPEFNSCFYCTTSPRNLVSQSVDLPGVDFACVNTSTIAGKTLTQYNELITGVRMDGLPGAPVTNSWADYQVKVPCGWSGTVTPVKYGWSFSSAAFSNVMDRLVSKTFVGSPVRHVVSGSVRDSAGKGVAGVKLNGLYPTSQSELNVTDAGGHYLVTVYHGWSGSATPTLAGYSFAPASRAYTKVETNQANQDYVATQAAQPAPPPPPGR